MFEHEETLKVGDAVIVVRCNHSEHLGKVAVVSEIDPSAFGSRGIFAIKFRLESGFEAWGRVIPASSLMRELV